MSRLSAGKPSRRTVVDALLALGGLGSLASVFYPVIRYLKPLPDAGPGGPMQLSAEQVASLERKKMLIVRVGGRRVIVFVDSAGELHALSARCTHEGCTVEWQPAQAVVLCACHNGRFAADGRVIAGPPPRPLPRYSARRDASGGITVSAETTT
jgi:cytochrome b6-f complex iron-sulfur subunit